MTLELTPKAKFEVEVKDALYDFLDHSASMYTTGETIVAALTTFTESLAVQVEAGKKEIVVTEHLGDWILTQEHNRAKDEDAALLRASVQ